MGHLLAFFFSASLHSAISSLVLTALAPFICAETIFLVGVWASLQFRWIQIKNPPSSSPSSDSSSRASPSSFPPSSRGLSSSPPFSLLLPSPKPTVPFSLFPFYWFLARWLLLDSAGKRGAGSSTAPARVATSSLRFHPTASASIKAPAVFAASSIEAHAASSGTHACHFHWSPCSSRLLPASAAIVGFYVGVAASLLSSEL